MVPAAWGGLWRARRAVRAAPKTRNCITSRVKVGIVGADYRPSRLALREGGLVALAAASVATAAPMALLPRVLGQQQLRTRVVAGEEHHLLLDAFAVRGLAWK